MTSEFSNDPLIYPPIPVATGTVIDDPDRPGLARVSGISLRLRLEDGRHTEVDLQQTLGAWWHPMHRTPAGS